MAKIAHLASVHYAFDTRIFARECRALASAGYEVVLILPADRDQTADGVRIRALPFPRNRFDRMWGTTWRVFRAAMAERADAYHFHDSELLPWAVLLRLLGKRVVYDIHENLPQAVMSKHWIPRWLRRCVASIAAFAEWVGACAFNRLVAANPPTARRFPQHKTVLLRNFPSVEELAQTVPQTYEEREPLVVYVGGLSVIRGVGECVEAIGKVNGFPNAKLVLGGRFQPKGLEQKVAGKAGWARTDYRGWLDRESVARLLAESRVGLCLLHSVPNYVENYPVKLFEYMAAELPVVCSDLPPIREVLEQADCGLIVPPADADAAAKAIEWLLSHPSEACAMGKRGKRAVVELYDWNREKEKLLQLYRELLS